MSRAEQRQWPAAHALIAVLGSAPTLRTGLQRWTGAPVTASILWDPHPARYQLDGDAPDTLQMPPGAPVTTCTEYLTSDATTLAIVRWSITYICAPASAPAGVRAPHPLELHTLLGAPLPSLARIGLTTPRPTGDRDAAIITHAAAITRPAGTTRTNPVPIAYGIAQIREAAITSAATTTLSPAERRSASHVLRREE